MMCLRWEFSRRFSYGRGTKPNSEVTNAGIGTLLQSLGLMDINVLNFF